MSQVAPEIASGRPLNSKDTLKLFEAVNKSIAGLKQQVVLMERQRLKDNFDRIPKDIKYLTKTEAELKKELVLHIEDAESCVSTLKIELQRLRREHMDNDSCLQRIIDKHEKDTEKLDDIHHKLQLTDTGMATLFKLHQISACMELQDEEDRKSIMLMGGQPAEKKQIGATKLPTDHFLAPSDPTLHKEPVVGLDRACMTCATTQNNEQTYRAFKLACLNYKPSQVRYEQAEYSRNELIEAKQMLMKYCLGQLKHLDLSSIDHIEPISPRHVPTLPKTDDLGQSSIYSERRSPTREKETTLVPRLVGNRQRANKKESSFIIRQSNDPPKTARSNQRWIPN